MVPSTKTTFVSMECFHMTSRRPYWCPKTMKRRPCWSPKPIFWELNSLLGLPPFRVAQLLIRFSVVCAKKRSPGGGKTRGSGTEKRCSHKWFHTIFPCTDSCTNTHRGQTQEHAQCTRTRSPAAKISRAKI